MVVHFRLRPHLKNQMLLRLRIYRDWGSSYLLEGNNERVQVVLYQWREVLLDRRDLFDTLVFQYLV